MNLLRSIFLLAIFFLGANFAHAASLYMEPQQGTFAEGGSFVLKVRVDPINECVNAGTIVLNYPQNTLRAIDVVRGNSIFSLWPEEPVIDQENGIIRFSGGIPGGYCGRIQGDPGLTNILAEVIFTVPGFTIGPKGDDSGEITFGEDTAILRNDGLGTPSELTISTSQFSIVPQGQEDDSEDWIALIENDTTPPEPFSVELLRDDSIAGGKWFIVFHTLDKQTGIDYFEVYEGSIENDLVIQGDEETAATWVRATSPYILKDQTLNSVIRVRARDKAGNTRLAATIPDESLRKEVRAPLNKTVFYSVLGGIGIILFGFVVFLMYRSLRKKKDEARDTIVNNSENEFSPELQPNVDASHKENEGEQHETY